MVFHFLRTARKAHVIPLRRFLEAILHQDLRNFFSETCFEVRYALYINVLAYVCSFLATEDQIWAGVLLTGTSFTVHAQGVNL